MYIKDFNQFINENLTNESMEQIDLTKGYALVVFGGGIGGTKGVMFMSRDGAGTVYNTSDDLEEMKARAARSNKNLTPGEKSYYRMKYKVIELTPTNVSNIIANTKDKSRIITN